MPETPKPATRRLREAALAVIGGRRDAMNGARRARRAHAATRSSRSTMPWSAKRGTRPSTHRAIAVRASAHGAARSCVHRSSGETTVHVTGAGRGGRNQEFALALAPRVRVGADAVARRRASGTDGIDGPTDAAGAIADSTTLDRAGRARLVPHAVSRRQQCVHVLRGAGRSHSHGADRHERRRPPNISGSLKSNVFS